MARSLTREQITTAAQRLTNARLAVSHIDDLGDCTPTDPGSAHKIATAHAEQLGWESIGWKVGCTSTRAMQILNCPEPFPGRIFDGTVYGPELLPHNALRTPLLESEFAFVLGKNLPPRDELYSLDELKEATLAVIPSFEIVSSRYTDWLAVDYLSLIADSGQNGGVVFGDPVGAEHCPLLADVEVTLAIDDEVVSSGRGADILGDPWRSLEWLVNHLSARQIGLCANEFVFSGTCTGAELLPAGSTATATFSGFGEVTVTRTAPN